MTNRPLLAVLESGEQAQFCHAAEPGDDALDIFAR
jgi:hypothetical protein